MSKTNSMSKYSTMTNKGTMTKRMSKDSWVGNSMMTDSMSNWMSESVSISSNAIISDISNITIIIISMIGNMLSTAIREVDRVRTFYNTGTIIGLSLVEGSTRVVISNSICVSVRRGLSKVRLGISTNSMMDNWSMVENRSMGNSYWVSNSHWMSHSMTNSVSKTKSNSMVNIMSKELRSSRSCGNESSKTGERLHAH